VEYSSPELIGRFSVAVGKEEANKIFQNEVKAINDHHSVDSRFEWSAYDRQKKIEGLETIEEHFDENNQMKSMGWRELLFSRRAAKCNEKTVAESYLQGSEEKWQFMNEHCISSETYKTLILRNQRMAAKIDSILKDPSTEVGFFVPGAAHLPGPDGINALLQSQGWKIERVVEDFQG
jgi:uncharacterized protein YbaP (TraB family)